MVAYNTGADIFAHEHRHNAAIVNPTNAIGPMGAGLARAFAQRYVGLQELYKGACQGGHVDAGGIFPARVNPMTGCVDKNGSLSVINLATKHHWRNPSRLEWIEQGLKSLADQIVQRTLPTGPVSALAIPQLGCGLGGLDWSEVAAVIEPHAQRIEETGVEVTICGPLVPEAPAFVPHLAPAPDTPFGNW